MQVRGKFAKIYIVSLGGLCKTEGTATPEQPGAKSPCTHSLYPTEFKQLVKESLERERLQINNLHSCSSVKTAQLWTISAPRIHSSEGKKDPYHCAVWSWYVAPVNSVMWCVECVRCQASGCLIIAVTSRESLKCGLRVKGDMIKVTGWRRGHASHSF